MMMMMMVCLILLSISGLQWEQHAAALPAAIVQVRAGEDATLQCPLLDASSANASSSAKASSSTLSWYRKAAGRRPELLLTFRSTLTRRVKYGAGVGPDKVSVSADGLLLLHDAKQNDSAVYFCGVTEGEERKKPAPQEVTTK